MGSDPSSRASEGTTVRKISLLGSPHMEREAYAKWTRSGVTPAVCKPSAAQDNDNYPDRGQDNTLKDPLFSYRR